MPWIANVYATRQNDPSTPTLYLRCDVYTFNAMLLPLLNAKRRPHNGTIVHMLYLCEK
jgi:hypothetical protein